MTKYLVLYRSPISAREQMANTTPEQAQAGMEAWMAWAGKAGDGVVDLGSPLGTATTLGPEIRDSTHFGGFSVLQGESLEAVTNVLTGHPHLEWGGSIQVVEFLAIPGMG